MPVGVGPRRLVFLDLGEGRFQPQQVQVGAEADGMYEVLSGLHAGDRVFLQLPAVGERADHPGFAGVIIKINRRPAHARDGQVVFEIIPAEFDQHHIAAGIEVFEDRDDFDIEAVDFRAQEDRKSIPLHAGANFADAHVFGGIKE